MGLLAALKTHSLMKKSIKGGCKDDRLWLYF